MKNLFTGAILVASGNAERHAYTGKCEWNIAYKKLANISDWYWF